MRRSFNSQHTEIATTLTGALALHSEVRTLNRNPRSALPPPAQSQHRLNKHSGKTGSPPFSSSDAPWDVSTFCQAILALRCSQAARPFCGGMLPLLLQLSIIKAAIQQSGLLKASGRLQLHQKIPNHLVFRLSRACTDGDAAQNRSSVSSAACTYMQWAP